MSFSFNRNSEFSLALSASILLFGNLFLFRPAIIYQGNSPFFTYSLLQMALLLIPCALFFSVIAVAPIIGKEGKIARIYSAFLTSVAVCSFVNSTFFAGSTGLLDGRSFEVITDAYYTWGNSITLCIILLLTFWLTRNKFKEQLRSY